MPNKKSNTNINKNQIKFYCDNHSSLFLPLISNNFDTSQWHKIVANINNYHLINPPPDGDYLFCIMSQIALINNWQIVKRCNFDMNFILVNTKV